MGKMSEIDIVMRNAWNSACDRKLKTVDVFDMQVVLEGQYSNELIADWLRVHDEEAKPRLDQDLRYAYTLFTGLIPLAECLEIISHGKYSRKEIDAWLGDHPLTNINTGVWATHTDMPNSPHERKEYRYILTDSGKETRFILRLHADSRIEVEPYTVADYDYTDMDHDEEDEDEFEYYGDSTNV